MSRLLIYDADYPLVFESSIIDKYPNIKELLKKYRNKKLYQDDISKFDIETQKDLQQLKQIRDFAHQEWKALPKYRIADPQEDIRCSKCNRKIKYICYIQNTVTGQELIIGRECKKYFSELFRNIDINQLHKREEKLIRSRYLNDMFGNIGELIDNWFVEINNQPIVLPTRIDSEYRIAGSTLRTLYKNCIEKNITEEDLKKIEEILIERQLMLNKINNYVMDNINNKWVATKNIEKELTHTAVINAIKKTGYITRNVAGFITEKNFMNMVADICKKLFDQYEIYGWAIIPKQKGYLIQYRSFNLICSHKKLFDNYGDYIFNESIIDNFDINKFIDICAIDLTSLNDTLYPFKQIFKRTILNVFDIDLEKDEIIFREISEENSYIQIKYLPLLNKYKSLLFDKDQDTLEQAIKYIRTITHKRYTREQIIAFREEFNDEMKFKQRLRKR